MRPLVMPVFGKGGWRGMRGEVWVHMDDRGGGGRPSPGGGLGVNPPTAPEGGDAVKFSCPECRFCFKGVRFCFKGLRFS